MIHLVFSFLLLHFVSQFVSPFDLLSKTSFKMLHAPCILLKIHLNVVDCHIVVIDTIP